jgi:hypothetical protein
MSFMEREVTDKQAWFQIDGNCGTDYVPASVVRYPRIHRLCIGATVERDSYSQLFSLLHSYVKDYTENTCITGITGITGITLIEGYGARLSAPGYLDCTDWAVFDTEQEAEEYLDENYPDDEEGDE